MASVHEMDGKQMGLRAVNTAMKGAIEAGSQVVVRNVGHVHGVAAGLKKGVVRIKGAVGDYAGALNDGATITIEGTAGNYVADNMTAGVVVVDGDAGYCAAPYGYGGTTIIRGSAGDFSATLNKGGTVVIGKDAGHDVATYMMAGDVVILGNAGENLANYLIRGAVFVQGKWASLGHNTKVVEVTDADAERLAVLFKAHGVQADARKLKKIIPETDKPFYAKSEAAKPSCEAASSAPPAGAKPAGKGVN